MRCSPVRRPARASSGFTGALLAGLVVAQCLCAAHSCVAIAADRPSSASLAYDDAHLWDIEFADPLHGWAVGDRGVIWATDDAGERWHRQESGVDLPLLSVHFRTPGHGWIAGARALPHLALSEGLVLETRNAGERWSRLERAALPGLRKLGFSSAAHGWALAEACAMYPVGLFGTDDGGRTWNPLAGGDALSAVDADISPAGEGMIVDERGQLHFYQGGSLRKLPLRAAATTADGASIKRASASINGASASTKRATVRKVRRSERGWAVAIGEQGLVVVSRDDGETWQPAALEHHDVDPRCFSWSAIELRGDACWIAGTPGTMVLHTHDQGRSWQWLRTDQTLPLSALCFVDQRRGYAVGALGTILGTRDGGKSWTRLNGPARQPAWLGIFPTSCDVPLELAARLSAEDRYLGAVTVLEGAGDEQAHDQGPTRRRAHEALVAAGASGLESIHGFPILPEDEILGPEAVVARWDRLHDGQALQRLEQALAQSIRMWRPEVVCTSVSSPRGARPLDRLFSQAVMAAVELAGEEDEQQQAQGLAPWKVKRLFSATATGESAQVTITPGQFCPGIGRTLAAQTHVARATLGQYPDLKRTPLGFRMVASARAQEAGVTDFLAGLSIPSHQEPRRMRAGGARLPGEETVSRATHRGKHIDALVAAVVDRPQLDRYTQQAGALVADLDDATAGALLYELALRYADRRDFDQASEVCLYLVEKYPQHPLGPAAISLVVRFASSGELLAEWARDKKPFQLAEIPAAPSARSEKELWPVPSPAAASTADVLGQSDSSAASADEQQYQRDRVRRRRERPLALVPVFEKRYPLLLAEPEVSFALATAARETGNPRQSERFLLAARRMGRGQDWADRVLGERWVATREGRSRLPSASAALAPDAPQLDGKLHEQAWRDAPAVVLAHVSSRSPAESGPARAAPGTPATRIRFAYNASFLFLAIENQRRAAALSAPGEAARPVEQPGSSRTRDGASNKLDRVQVYLDVDRDFSSSVCFTVDEAGGVAEASLGDVKWNPTWYVAAAPTDEGWNVEAAIPWVELCTAPPAPGAVLALGLTRVTPGVGELSWLATEPGSGGRGGFGYLCLEPGTARGAAASARPATTASPEPTALPETTGSPVTTAAPATAARLPHDDAPTPPRRTLRRTPPTETEP